MKIGVAIPCYIGHIQALFDLLDCIENQTRIPDKVVVSCSSTETFPEIVKKYHFTLEIIVTPQKKNAAENRNIAASKLTDMDYITFFDADDIMVPQRIEILLKVFEEHQPDIILHNYFDNVINKVNMMINLENNVRINHLIQAPSGCITQPPGYNDKIDKIHHSQVTVKSFILDEIKFSEEPEYINIEDCVFCYKVFSLPNIKNAYIKSELSYYRSSNSQGYMVL